MKTLAVLISLFVTSAAIAIAIDVKPSPEECRQLREVHARLTPQQLDAFAKLLSAPQLAAVRHCLAVTKHPKK